MYWNMYSTPINFRLSRSIFQIEANKTIPCLIMFMAMVCRDGSIHPRCHGGRRYVERADYWKQRISPGATSDPVSQGRGSRPGRHDLGQILKLC